MQQKQEANDSTHNQRTNNAKISWQKIKEEVETLNATTPAVKGKISLQKIFKEVQELNATTGFLAKTLRPIATTVLALGFLHVFFTAFYFIVILIGFVITRYIVALPNPFLASGFSTHSLLCLLLHSTPLAMTRTSMSLALGPRRRSFGDHC